MLALAYAARALRSITTKEKIMKMTRFLSAAVAAMLAFALPNAQAADTYPSKPIKLIVPFPAGGTTDVLARVVGQELTKSWGQQVIIDNRPGAGDCRR